MRAQVFHGPGDLRFENLPVPEPGPGEIVLKVEAALTCGTDVKTLRRGHPVMIPRVPTVFGHEFAGTVTAVGASCGPSFGEIAVIAGADPIAASGFGAASRFGAASGLGAASGSGAASARTAASEVASSFGPSPTTSPSGSDKR